MPCESYGSCDHSSYEEEIDELTQNLCYLCGTLKHEKLYSRIATKRIKKWFDEHNRNDKGRVVDKMRKHYRRNPNDHKKPQEVADKFIAAAEKVHPVSEWHKEWFLKLATKASSIGRKIVERSTLAAKAKSKLTKEERMALGL